MNRALRGLLSVDRGPGFPDRRPFRRGPDTDQFQGDGWRWTLALLLPNVLLWRTTGRCNDLVPVGAPFTLDMLVLNRAQRMACYAEWYLTQVQLQAELHAARSVVEAARPYTVLTAPVDRPQASNPLTDALAAYDATRLRLGLPQDAPDGS